MVRPEQLEVAPAAPARAGSGGPDAASRDGLDGLVEECRYYGHDAMLHIRAEGRGEPGLLLARVHGEQALPVGTPVSVAARGAVTPLPED